MSTPSLDISNVVQVSVSTPPTGLSDYQVNNIAIFTKEVPLGGSLVSITNPGIYASPAGVLADWAASSEVYAMAVNLFSQTPNLLDGGGQLIVFPMQIGDTLGGLMPTAQKTQYFHGVIEAGYDISDEEMEAAAAAAKSIKALYLASHNLKAALTDTTGVFAIIHSASIPECRKFLYTQGGDRKSARLAGAAYLGRLMSVDFSGSATALTMHMKQLANVPGDSGLVQADLDRAMAIGVDTYPMIAGRPTVFCSGADDFSDNIYNLHWLVFAITVTGFNTLATTSTKIPQTEQGMAILRGAYIKVLEQGVINGFLAPGAWNSPELFGDPDALRRSISERGWYVWNQPIAQQQQSNRVARKAPILKIAVKYAGAFHSTAVVIAVNQ